MNVKKKSSRLKPVEKLAEDKAESAAADMVYARNTHQSHEQKLNELISYRVDYIEQFQNRGKNGMQASQVQQYQLFINQLDVAIQQQKVTVNQAGDVLNNRQNQWRDKHSHKRALNKVVNRFRKEENKAADMVEQADLDAHNTRQHNLSKSR
ncbi:MAG: flagellar export protein FliJ [Gammaproteobacteria bacterium]|nr:flagellar export protein FliJ [Gammaproteobacteria bacterium]